MIASLDRIDNELGYIEGNLHWVCKRVNYMKHTMTHEYFLSWIESIYKFCLSDKLVENSVDLL